MLYPEDFEPGKAGAILNVGPEDKKCTGSFHYKRMSANDIIDVVAHYITNVVLAHFENKANKVHPDIVVKMQPLFEQFNEPCYDRRQARKYVKECMVLEAKQRAELRAKESNSFFGCCYR